MAEWKAEVLYNFDSTNEVELGLKVRACFLPHCSYVEQPKPPHSPYPALLPPPRVRRLDGRRGKLLSFAGPALEKDGTRQNATEHGVSSQ